MIVPDSLDNLIMKQIKTLAAILGAVFVAAPIASNHVSDAQDFQTASQPGAAVYFIHPLDGAVVNSPITVRFGLKGMGVAPAGVEKAGTGHHHLIIDAPLPPMDENIINDENHLHFGGGQTETTIKVAPGKHTLQLLLGDQNHLPHSPPVYSRAITITVSD